MDQNKSSSSHENIVFNNRAATRDEDGYNKGVPVHIQVMKIKKEFEKIKHPSLLEADMRRVLREITRQRSRSPLGLAETPISVGN
ncbi:Rubisco methyltransferase family protein isoform 1 [Hibiscus syriacus]|uniref:Rubisco methyltransferase family protein isoform 1 n=1 Tax=Hibiscus syriacus TaxID=106335 RepID=A0A6A3A773_HIBSY|nr:Rubisco methyltransferase family protein isoform 1 [Hibiscus syriacus]